MSDTIVKMPAPDPRYYINTRLGSKSDMIVVREIWSENVYEVFDGDLSDTGIVVDIGANIGAFTLYTAMLGAKKVIAVEPEPNNSYLLGDNVAANMHNTPDCEFLFDKRAIGGSKGDVFINDDHGDSNVVHRHSSTMNTPAGKADYTKMIRMTTLDGLFEDYGLEYIDVLKIDIEGLEGEVILNASKQTLMFCRYITLEYDQHANDLGAIVEKLSQTHQIKYVGANGGMLFAKRY